MSNRTIAEIVERIEAIDREQLEAIEVAQCLGKTRQSVYRMARRGELEGAKIGGTYRFSKAVVLDYVKGSADFLS